MIWEIESIIIFIFLCLKSLKKYKSEQKPNSEVCDRYVCIAPHNKQIDYN